MVSPRNMVGYLILCLSFGMDLESTTGSALTIEAIRLPISILTASLSYLSSGISKAYFMFRVVGISLWASVGAYALGRGRELRCLYFI